ncbi:MAG: 16S rRNA (adenine(1518)-N(6)/adenine(1519)-N(6))-dimethyltransferase RsmA [Roseiflexaceae bacterium]|nr:16S rRNA (adenine(1518)-N(6)/adenine(1519)-N(6))-dimethyltransferase RsmA [Roseiflexaceae bacterium]
MKNPYLTLGTLKSTLRAFELRPSREMGQNFLFDGAVLAQIVAAAELQPDQTVIEVGPGFGVLTWELVQQARDVIAVELDKRLVEHLQGAFATTPNLKIIQNDILRVPPAELLQNTATEHYKVVANLPYAITSPALRHFLEADHKPDLIVVLVQWEVAERITAQVGDLSMLAHAIQMYAEPAIVAKVGRESFYPAPVVDSAILRLRIRPQPAVDVDNIEQLMRVIKAGFLHARKTLSNALPSGLAAMGQRVTRDQVLAALHSAGVDPQRRAETVTLPEWAMIYRTLSGDGVTG